MQCTNNKTNMHLWKLIYNDFYVPTPAYAFKYNVMIEFSTLE